MSNKINNKTGQLINRTAKAVTLFSDLNGFDKAFTTPQPLVKAKTFERAAPGYFFKPEQPKLENWDSEILELEKFFTGITLPNQPVKLNRCSTITNCSLFIESHFATVKAQNGKRVYRPYLDRLNELKQILSN